MARCNQCGSELPDYYTSCPNCGGSVVRQAPPVQPAQPMNGYVPMAQQREVTGMGAWFRRILLSFIKELLERGPSGIGLFLAPARLAVEIDAAAGAKSLAVF